MSKRNLKILFLVLTAPFALLGVFAVVMFCYVGFTYDNSVTLVTEKKFPSPDDTKKAVLFKASGGGAAGWIHHSVAILNSNENLEESVFKSDKTFFSKRCCKSININWLNDSTLHICYIKEDEYAVYKIANKWNGISIKYDEIKTSQVQ